MAKARGFTLIELLIVITIIGLLATFVIASFTSAQSKARDSRRKSDMDSVKKALELAKSDCTSGGYPSATGADGMARYDDLKPYLQTLNYMRTVPDDPRDDNANFQYRYTESEHNGNSFTTGGCLNIGAGNRNGNANYALRATLENDNDTSGLASFTRCTGKPGMPGTYPIAPPTFYYICND